MAYLTGIILTVFLSIILASKKGKTLADIILLVWLGVIGFNLLLYYLQINNLHFNYPFLLGWIFPLPMLQWSLLYLYILSLTSKKKLGYKSSIHFAPFLLSFALIARFFFLPADQKIEIYKKQGQGFEKEMYVNIIAFLVLGILYITLSVLKLRQYRKTLKNEFSNSEKINLNWVQFLIGGMAIIFLVILFKGDDKLIYTCEAGFVIFIGYYGIKQVGIFNQQRNFDTVQTEIFITEKIPSNNADSIASGNIIGGTTLPVDEKPIVKDEKTIAIQDRPTITNEQPSGKGKKYQKSTLNESAVLQIHEALKKLMQEQKLHENPDLTLDNLADILKILPNHLSQVINSMEQKNFYDYINQLRVNSFLLLISKKENHKYTLLSLAFECGFNSKTSFNRNFKKVTGLSPTEYIKERQIKVSEQ